jgi:DNA-binding CsgD family transcriptional regulator
VRRQEARRACIELQALARTLVKAPLPASEPPPEWRGRVAATWAVVARFEIDGEQFILAREREALATARALLSRRELDVLLALPGARANKAIAAALGISPSTVGVLLARAAKKLRLTTRPELIALAERLLAASPPPSPPPP